jgi:hypothetical protein
MTVNVIVFFLLSENIITNCIQYLEGSTAEKAGRKPSYLDVPLSYSSKKKNPA